MVLNSLYIPIFFTKKFSILLSFYFSVSTIFIFKRMTLKFRAIFHWWSTFWVGSSSYSRPVNRSLDHHTLKQHRPNNSKWIILNFIRNNLFPPTVCSNFIRNNQKFTVNFRPATSICIRMGTVIEVCHCSCSDSYRSTTSSGSQWGKLPANERKKNKKKKKKKKKTKKIVYFRTRRHFCPVCYCTISHLGCECAQCMRWAKMCTIAVPEIHQLVIRTLL